LGATRPAADRIEAACLFNGPINGQKFRAYIEQFLISTLQPGDVVVLDNLGSHKGKEVRRAIRHAGAKLFFLPPYSPDLNPIEQAFAKLKHWLRQAQATNDLDAAFYSHGVFERDPAVDLPEEENDRD